eukprot:1187911-Prorocentrum_minimum.AAC.5
MLQKRPRCELSVEPLRCHLTTRELNSPPGSFADIKQFAETTTKQQSIWQFALREIRRGGGAFRSGQRSQRRSRESDPGGKQEERVPGVSRAPLPSLRLAFLIGCPNRSKSTRVFLIESQSRCVNSIDTSRRTVRAPRRVIRSTGRRRCGDPRASSLSPD